ncbi:hypothetical protein CCB80_10245 [Armatimonadetes bacterium Uphvl-Ar1]|nr:hypothetical protein CCB80_10245 [Armatimonadetes bacterium Uphvl-Ar1]
MEIIPEIEQFQTDIAIAVVDNFHVQNVVPLRNFISSFMAINRDEFNLEQQWEVKNLLVAIVDSTNWESVLSLCGRAPVGLLPSEVWARLWPYLVLADGQTVRKTAGIRESNIIQLRPTFHSSDMDFLTITSRKLKLLGDVYNEKQLGTILDYVFLYVLKGEVGAKQTFDSMIVQWSSLRPHYIDYLKEEK